MSNRLTPGQRHAPNRDHHEFAPGDKVEYRSGFSSVTWLGEIIGEARYDGDDGWLIRPLSGSAPQAAQAVHPHFYVTAWGPDRWRYNAQADPPVYGGAPGAWQRVYESAPLKNAGCHCGADLDGRDCMCFEDV